MINLEYRCENFELKTEMVAKEYYRTVWRPVGGYWEEIMEYNTQQKAINGHYVQIARRRESMGMNE